MAVAGQQLARPVESANLADILERVLDKGIVIAGDVKISLVNVEILTLQIRLVVCSVDRAREIGLDWWTNNPAFGPAKPSPEALPRQTAALEERLARLEEAVAARNESR